MNMRGNTNDCLPARILHSQVMNARDLEKWLRDFPEFRIVGIEYAGDNTVLVVWRD